MSGFPKLFLMPGFDSEPGVDSVRACIEPQINYFVRHSDRIPRQNLRVLNMRAIAQVEHDARLHMRL